MTNQPTKKISSHFIYFFGAFGGILFGYDIGVMTGALPFLQKDWHLTDAGTIGWITSSLMLGAIVGGALAGQLSDKLGRRRMILAASFVFAIGSVMAGISPNDGVAWLLIARTLLGLAVGAASIVYVINGPSPYAWASLWFESIDDCVRNALVLHRGLPLARVTTHDCLALNAWFGGGASRDSLLGCVTVA